MEQREQHIIDELKKGKTPVPSDDYFAQLKHDLMTRATGDSPGKAPVRTVPLYRKWWAAASIAASVILVVSLFIRSRETVGAVTHTGPDWNSVSREEVIAYVHEHIDDFETEAIAASLDSLPEWNAGLQTASVDASTNPSTGRSSYGQKKENDYDKLLKEIDRDDILEYIDNEAIELDDEF